MKIIQVIFVLSCVSCSTTQNYDKSMLPNADPAILSKVNSRVLVGCMQLPVPHPPVPINANHDVSNSEIYDTNDCIDNKMAQKDSEVILNEKEEKKKFKLEIDLDQNEK